MQNHLCLTSSCLLVMLMLYGCDHNKEFEQSNHSPIIDLDPSSCSSEENSNQNKISDKNQNVDRDFPEPASGYRLGLEAKISNRYMVVANSPLATKAGCEILKSGGSAIDAAIAVQAVLGLVEPQASTIAGSGFMLYYDAKTKAVTAYDGRETAPAAATNYYLLREDQDNINSLAPVPSLRRSGRSIGVPGVMRMLEMAHQEHGKLPWNQLFNHSIEWARQGFKVPGRLADAIALNQPYLLLDKDAVRTFFKADGTPYKYGEILKNTAYSETIKNIAQNGANAMYTGKMANNIVNKAKQSVGDDENRTAITPSLMTLDDLKNYKAVKRQAICSTYRNQYYVCTMPPPSSGGIAVAQTLGILENFDLSQYPPTNIANEGGIPNAMAVHLISEAERLAYADRDQYVADTDFVKLPANGIQSLLDKNYLKQRAQMIDPNKSMGIAPAGDFSSRMGKDTTSEHGTTQFTIIDAYGNVASVTSTVESSMGSFHMVDGFLLSNQLTDFSTQPKDNNGRWIANRIEANKRPRSTMAPTIVFNGKQIGDVYIATGSPGGGTIIQFVVKTLVGLLDWNMDPQQAASLVNFGAANNTFTNLDSSNPTLNLSDIVIELQKKGHQVNQSAQTSGTSTIMKIVWKNQIKYMGGVDPRREGLVMGSGAL